MPSEAKTTGAAASSQGGGFWSAIGNWFGNLKAPDSGSAKQSSESKDKAYSPYQVPSLNYGQTNDYSTYQSNQAKSTTEGLDTIADFIGNNTGNFGKGYTYGYYGSKVTLAPFLAYRAAKQTKQVLGMQAELSDLQAKAYQTAAEDCLRAGQQQVAAVTYEQGQRTAATRVSQASAGVVIGGSGSAAETMASQKIITEMQVNQIMANSIAQSFGYQRAKTQQKMNTLAIKSAQGSISPFTAAITGFLSEAAQAAPKVASVAAGSAAQAPNGAGAAAGAKGSGGASAAGSTSANAAAGASK